VNGCCATRNDNSIFRAFSQGKSMNTTLKSATVARALFALVLAIAPLSALHAQDATTSALTEAKTATDMGDLARALDLYRQAAEAGSTDAAIQLARLHLEGGKGLATDYGEARLWAQRAADEGDSRGLLYLGRIWMEGLGVAADTEKARGYFLKSDVEGDLKAARYLGLIDKAAGEAKSAAEWFKKGAASGDITSQFYLGQAYQTGDGVEQDFALAMTWYAKAAERGDIIASDGLVGMASLYENGQGVAVDKDRAIALYRKAAVLGNKAAMNALERLVRLER
jgi:uncharacterized protein